MPAIVLGIVTLAINFLGDGLNGRIKSAAVRQMTRTHREIQMDTPSLVSRICRQW